MSHSQISLEYGTASLVLTQVIRHSDTRARIAARMANAQIRSIDSTGYQGECGVLLANEQILIAQNSSELGTHLKRLCVSWRITSRKSLLLVRPSENWVIHFSCTRMPVEYILFFSVYSSAHCSVGNHAHLLFFLIFQSTVNSFIRNNTTHSFGTQTPSGKF